MLWDCLECHTRYACDLQACPNCGSTDRVEDGMAKISRLRGPSNARDPKLNVKPEPDPVVTEDAAPEADAEEPKSDTERGEQPSPGTNSSASTRKTTASSKKSAAPRRGRVRTTESPSTPDPEASSSAPGATTSTSETGGSSDGD